MTTQEEQTFTLLILTKQKGDVMRNWLLIILILLVSVVMSGCADPSSTGKYIKVDITYKIEAEGSPTINIAPVAGIEALTGDMDTATDGEQNITPEIGLDAKIPLSLKP